MIFEYKNTFFSCLTALLISSAPAISYGNPDNSLSAEYAQSAWPSGHRDQSNTDYVPFPLAKNMGIVKHLLIDNAILWPAVTGINGEVYISTGKGEGYSHLQSFDELGNLRWQTEVQLDKNDLDSTAVINAPTVDARGRVYQADSNQLFSFSSDGQQRWVTDLSAHGVEGGFIGTILLEGGQHGLVGGISRNGILLLFSRETGELARPAFDLSQGKEFSAKQRGKSAPSGLWKGLMDANIIQELFNLIQGWEFEVANTPAVHPQTGRIFITANAPSGSGKGLLYGIDVGEQEISLAFALEMSDASGTSPSISHDGKQVYAVGGDGHMVAVSASTGKLLWRSETEAGPSASPSIGGDETIYSPFKDKLVAFHKDGSTKYQHSYNEYCEQRLEKTGFFWGLFFSKPSAFIDSIVTVSGDGTGRMNIVCGNYIRPLSWFQNERTAIPLPLDSTLVEIDLATGEIRGEPLALPDTSEGFITPAENGNLFVSLSGAMRSSFYHSLNWLLPDRFSVAAPTGGMLILAPSNRDAFALDGIARGKEAVYEALALMQKKDYQAAKQRLAGVASHVNLSYGALVSARPERTFNAGIVSSAASQIENAVTEIDRKRYGAARSALLTSKLMFQQLNLILLMEKEKAKTPE